MTCCLGTYLEIIKTDRVQVELPMGRFVPLLTSCGKILATLV